MDQQQLTDTANAVAAQAKSLAAKSEALASEVANFAPAVAPAAGGAAIETRPQDAATEATDALVALGFVHNRPSDESCAAREMPMPPALRGFPRAASKVQLPASSIHV